jgi:hypothetical protein
MNMGTSNSNTRWASCLFVTCLLFTGCSLLPQKKEKSEALKTTENISSNQKEMLRRVTLGQKSPSGSEFRVGGMFNRVEVQAATNTAVVTPGLVVPPPTLPYREELTFESAVDQDVGTKTDAKAASKVSIPLGVSIGLVGVGLMLLLAAVQLWRRSSAAASAAYAAADSGLATAIRNVRNFSTISTDPLEIAKLKGMEAELEAARGRTASGN